MEVLLIRAKAGLDLATLSLVRILISWVFIVAVKHHGAKMTVALPLVGVGDDLDRRNSFLLEVEEGGFGVDLGLTNDILVLIALCVRRCEK